MSHYKITIEVRTEALAPNRYGVIGMRPDGRQSFRFDGLWSSSLAEMKAEDYLLGVNPNATIHWDTQPGEEEVGAILYRGFKSIREDSE